jgi:curved DNA-binding protein CbpA
MCEQYFKILEINTDATLKEVEQAYRDLAQIWHPDFVSTKNPRLKKKAEEKMKEINEARSKIIANLTKKKGGKTEGHNEWEQAERDKAAREQAERERAKRERAKREKAAQERAEAVKKAEQTRKRTEDEIFKKRAESMAAKSKAKKNGGDHEADFKKYLVIFLPVFVISVGIIFFYGKNDIKIKHSQQIPSPQLQPPEASLKKPIKKQPPLISVQQGKRIDSIPLSLQQQDDDLKQMLINKIDNIISEAENHLKSKQYLKSKTSHESALEMISDSQFKKDSLFLARKRKIEEVLLNKDIVCGSQGFIKLKNKWIDPNELKNIITQITDPHIRLYLINKYSGQNIHKNDVKCNNLILKKKSKSSSHFRVFYKWEVWTFKTIKEGELSLDIVYNSETDQWQFGKIYEKKSG